MWPYEAAQRVNYQLGNEREKHCDQHHRRSVLPSCTVRERPPDAMVARLIGHTAGTQTAPEAVGS